MLTSCQIRAARGMIRWSLADLARESDLAVSTLARMEKVLGTPATTVDTMARVRRAFEAQGLVFVPDDGTPAGGPGVRFGIPHPARGMISCTLTGRQVGMLMVGARALQPAAA